MDDNLDVRKEKVKKFFSNKYTLLFILVLLIALTIRIYYFSKLYDQPCWWDECDYLSMGKALFGKLDYEYSIQRPILFPLLAGIFFASGLNDAAVRFLLALVPSLGVIIVMYFFGKHLYDEKVALIAAFLMSVFWILLFDSLRFHTDALALLFAMLALYFFWKCYIEKQSSGKLWLVGLFIGLAFLVRIVYALLVVLFLIYLLLIERFKFLKEKKLWIAVIVCLLVLAPYFIWSKINLGSSTAFKHGYTDYGYKAANLPIAWHIFPYFPLFTQFVLFIVFLLSLFYIIFELAIGYDIMTKEKKLKAHLFLLLLIIIPLIYFVFIERSAGEPRWFVYFAVSMFLFIGVFLVEVHNFIKKYNKYLAVFVIAGILMIGAYQEIKIGNGSMIEKSTSFIQLKQAGLWIKENSNKDDIVLTKSVPQVAFYSERKVIGLPVVTKEIVDMITSVHARYIIISPFDQATQEIFEFPSKYPNNLKPVNAYFLDKEKKQVILIVYEVVNYNF